MSSLFSFISTLTCDSMISRSGKKPDFHVTGKKRVIVERLEVMKGIISLSVDLSIQMANYFLLGIFPYLDKSFSGIRYIFPFLEITFNLMEES